MKSAFSSILMLVLIVLSGLATRFSRGVEVTIFLFVFAFAYLVRRNIVTDKRYLLACLVWFLYVILSYAKYPGENYFWPFSYFCNLTIVFAIVDYYREGFVHKFSSVMYFICLYSLLLFSWQLLSVDSMIPIWSALDMSDSLFDKPYTYYAHSFLYTIHQFKDVSKGVPRNSGFCWEPGAFSCFIVVAIYFQLLCDSYRIELNKTRYLVLFLTLLTTQSTTGVAGALVVLAGYLVNIRRSARGKYLVFALLIALPLMVVLPEQFEKIDGQLSDDLAEQVFMIDAAEHEKGLGRFQSVYILSIDFLNNPLLGVGADRSSTWVSRMGVDANPTSGVWNMLATYGLFLMIPFFLILGLTSKRLAFAEGGKGRFVLFFVVIVLGFSFSILETPIFLSVIFLGYFGRIRLGRQQEHVLPANG